MCKEREVQNKVQNVDLLLLSGEVWRNFYFFLVFFKLLSFSTWFCIFRFLNIEVIFVLPAKESTSLFCLFYFVLLLFFLTTSQGQLKPWVNWTSLHVGFHSSWICGIGNGVLIGFPQLLALKVLAYRSLSSLLLANHSQCLLRGPSCVPQPPNGQPTLITVFLLVFERWEARVLIYHAGLSFQSP